MNQWKDELDGVAGDFSKELGRLSQGIEKKIAKNSSRRALRSAAIVTVLVAVICLFIYEWQPFNTSQTAYSIDQPFYFDEDAYQFYYADLYYLEDEQARKDRAFQYLISYLTQQHTFFSQGYKIDKRQLEEKIKEITAYQLSIDSESTATAAKSINMSTKEFVTKLAAPIEAKMTIIQDMMDKFDQQLLYVDEIIKFETNYEQQINALAKELDVNYQKIFSFKAYTGKIVDVNDSSILVVNGVKDEDLKQLQPMEIVDKYNSGVWFSVNGIENYTFKIGDTVSVYYDAIDYSLPAQAAAIDVSIIEKAKREAVYENPDLLTYFEQKVPGITDEKQRKEVAYQLYVEWLSIERYAYDTGYEVDTFKYDEKKSEMLKTLTARNELIEKLMEIEIHQQLIQEWEYGRAIVQYDHVHVDYFKAAHEKELEQLAEKFGVEYDAEKKIPFYIARILSTDNGVMKVVNGVTAEQLLSLTEEELLSKESTALEFFYLGNPPTLSKGDIVKLYYNTLNIYQPTMPIKIDVIYDEK